MRNGNGTSETTGTAVAEQPELPTEQATTEQPEQPQDPLQMLMSDPKMKAEFARWQLAGIDADLALAMERVTFLQDLRSQLAGVAGVPTTYTSNNGGAPVRRTRIITQEQRDKMAAAAKKRWAGQRKADKAAASQHTPPPAATGRGGRKSAGQQ
jgi:hypothetical protein